MVNAIIGVYAKNCKLLCLNVTTIYELCIILFKPKEIKYDIKVVVGTRINWYGSQMQWLADLSTDYEDLLKYWHRSWILNDKWDFIKEKLTEMDII